MARGQKDASDPEDGPILSPEELDISDDEHVAELDDGRYVVSPNGPIDESVTSVADTDSGADRSHSGSSERPAEPHQSLDDLDRHDVHQWLSEEFEGIDSRYGFDVTGKFDGVVRQRQMVSNDVVTIFESLVLWYAQQIDNSTPVEEVLGILLMESNVPIRYPAASLQALLDSTGLSPDDTIADLMETVDDDGFRL
jgi:hypothetical protein